MNEWMNEWMSEWVNEWMNEWMNKWMNESMIYFNESWVNEGLTSREHKMKISSNKNALVNEYKE